MLSKMLNFCLQISKEFFNAILVKNDHGYLVTCASLVLDLDKYILRIKLIASQNCGVGNYKSGFQKNVLS